MFFCLISSKKMDNMLSPAKCYHIFSNPSVYFFYKKNGFFGFAFTSFRLSQYFLDKKMVHPKGFDTSLTLRCKLTLANRFAPEPLLTGSHTCVCKMLSHFFQILQCTFFIKKMVHPKGFEPLTFWSVARRSIQLSYGCTCVY